MSQTTHLFADADVIHAYSRAEALDDGVLIDATETARKMGYRWPVAFTAAAWEAAVEWADEDEDRKNGFTAQDTESRLHDALWMGVCAIKGATDTTDRIQYAVYAVPKAGKGCVPMPVRLIIHIGPGDTPEPVLTVLLPGES